MLEDTDLQGTYVFRGVEYHLSLSVRNSSLLSVVVEDKLTANQWKGTFDAAYIEDMTHKTGNYKQFHVFVSMLESAITQSSDSLSMDLLTFSDLESLRKRKAGLASHQTGGGNPCLTQKRYLILTYSVEFDKIHYPLPLPYSGKPEPEILQEKIRSLQAELHAIKQQETRSFRHREHEKLKQDYDVLLAEKESIEQEHIRFRQEVKHSTVATSAKGLRGDELRILKTAVKNLEEELLKEKAKHQRILSKRKKENQDLQNQLRDLRMSERTLKTRLKSVTNELADYKRRAVNHSYSYNHHTSTHGDVSRRSLNMSKNHSYRDRSTSRERYGGRQLNGEHRSRSKERPQTALESRRYTPNSDRLGGDPSPYSRPRSAGPSTRHRTPSPQTRSTPESGGRKRFNPTAYIEEKRRKQTQNNSGGFRSRSSPNHNQNNSRGSRNSRGAVRSSPNMQYRNSSQERLYTGRDLSRERVRTSSVESLNSLPRSRDPSPRGLRDSSPRGYRDPSPHGRNPVKQGYRPGTRAALRDRKTPNTSTPDHQPVRSRVRGRGIARSYNKENSQPIGEYNSKYENLENSIELDDIDARLQRIQAMMSAGL